MSQPEPVRYRYFTVEDFAPGIYIITNRSSGAIIGRIEWYAGWKKWVLVSNETTVWSSECLADVQDFIAKHAGKEEADVE